MQENTKRNIFFFQINQQKIEALNLSQLYVNLTFKHRGQLFFSAVEIHAKTSSGNSLFEMFISQCMVEIWGSRAPSNI